MQEGLLLAGAAAEAPGEAPQLQVPCQAQEREEEEAMVLPEEQE